MYEGKYQLISDEMKRTGIHILGICKHRWKGSGHFKSENDNIFIYSGGEVGGKNGVAFYLDKSTSKALLGYNPVSDRILTI